MVTGDCLDLQPKISEVFGKSTKLSTKHETCDLDVKRVEMDCKVDECKVKVLNGNDKEIQKSEQQRHLHLTKINTQHSLNLKREKSELELMFERKLGKIKGERVLESVFGVKGRVLGPNLKVKMKHPTTPKSRIRSDYCSPKKFKSVREMFIQMEEGEKLAKVSGKTSQKFGNLGHNGRFGSQIVINSINSDAKVPLERQGFDAKNPSKTSDYSAPVINMKKVTKLG